MDLLNSLVDLFAALYQVLVSLLTLVAPWAPLLCWIAFWTLAVDWVKLRQFFLQGGWSALLLGMFVTILVWGVVAPPESGAHFLFGLTVSNFVGKTVYVTGLVVITMLCGSVQLSGLCGRWAQFEDPEPAGHSH